MRISDADRKAYARDGVICLRGVFAPAWIERLRAATEEALAHPGPLAEDYTPKGKSGRAFNDLDPARRIKGFADFVHESPAARLCGQVMGSAKVNFFYDQLIVKEPGTAEKTPWHQDQPYWAVSGRDVCSIWLPLDPVGRESCVQYVAGSHLWPEHNPHHFADNSPYAGTGLPELPDIDADRGAYDIRTFDVQPGDGIVFQGMIVHGAPGNASADTRRRAYATRWCGDDARYCVRDGECAIPTRDPGLKDGDHLDCADFPIVWRADAALQDA